MIKNNTLPGTFPVTKSATVKESKHMLGIKSRVNKLKTYFHSNEKAVIAKSSKISKWNSPWRKKTTAVYKSNTVSMGTAFSLSIPITISNTTTHYDSNKEGSTSAGYSSVIQQSVSLPPIQIYGFMFLGFLFLFVVGFALFQIHRVISVLELAVDGIEFTLISFGRIISVLKSWV